MPLSKKRDRARKRLLRLERQLASPQITMRLRERKTKPVRECEVCGYPGVVDTHHEGTDRVEHTLCPNHHAQITRGLKTLEQLSPPARANRVQPKPSDEDILAAIAYLDNADVPTDDREMEPMPSYIDADGHPVYD